MQALRRARSAAVLCCAALLAGTAGAHRHRTDLERSWAASLSREGARHARGQTSVRDLVERGVLRLGDEIGWRADRKELEGEACEAGNRCVLEGRALLPARARR